MVQKGGSFDPYDPPLDPPLCVLMKGVTRLQLLTHPRHPPIHPLIHAIPDITVAVKKVAQNPAVLAS